MKKFLSSLRIPIFSIIIFTFLFFSLNFFPFENKKELIADCTWTGTWNTSWGKMYLVQTGNKVTGNYEYDDGKIEGTINGNILSGTWSEAPSYNLPYDAGEIEFTISSDCKSFTGKWRRGPTSGWAPGVTGTKISDTVPSQNNTQTQTGELVIILQINNPYMTVNGIKKEIDPGRGTVPVIVKGRTLVPIRAIIEELGGTIGWDGNERKVTIKLKNIQIELWIDKKNAKVNGTLKELDVPPQIINGRTMLPLRFVTEELGCTVDWDGTTKTITITYNGEEIKQEDINKISGEGEKIFGPEGGELILSDGTKLSVPQNAFSSQTKITLKSIINPVFYSKDALGFELTGLKELKGEIILYANGVKDLKLEELNIFGYDHENEEKFDFQYEYDQNSGLVKVKISPQSIFNKKLNYIFSPKVLNLHSNILGFKEKLSIYIGWTAYYTPKGNEKIIRMPYYEQIGGSCVSTSAQMILKFSGMNIQLPQILDELEVNDSDFGLGEYKISYSLKNYLNSKTSFTTYSIPYFGIAHMKWRVLSELDKGYPILLSWGNHAVVILGYTNNGENIIIHDPRNISPANNSDGTMYTVRSWDWIRNRHNTPTEKYLIVVIQGTFSSSSNLSIELPGKDEKGAMTCGDVSFYIIHPNTKNLTSMYELQIKPSEKNTGYIWTSKGSSKSLDFIPEDAEILKLKFNAFNGSNSSRDIEIQTAIEEDKDGGVGKKIISNSQKNSINEATLNQNSKVSYEYEYKLEDIRDFTLMDKDGKQKIFIHATLWEGGSTLRDYFIVKATLSSLPKVKSINPATGKGGDTITISGFSFGKAKSTKSKVLIGDKQIEIINWSDKEIKVKLPEDIKSGTVVVYTGEKYEYKSNEDIIFNTEIICNNFFSEVLGASPSWSNIDCKWESTNRNFYLCIEAKNGVIKGSGTCYGGSQEVSGTVDKDGNVKFSFTWKDPQTTDNYGYIVTGNFTGKFVKGCIFYGTATGKVRVYNKNPMYCKPYDIEKEFSSPMYDKNYKP